MGQYYNAILYNIEKDERYYLESWDFNNGCKLMEHSYIGNSYVESFCSLIKDSPHNVVWAGDYADCEESGSPFFIEDKINLHGQCSDDDEDFKSDFIFNKHSPSIEILSYNYILNHTKKEYVTLSKMKEKEPDDWGNIHPLPLLTVEGNGRGGGDYRGNEEGVGDWARDSISTSDSLPSDYSEIIPKFSEDN